jgi:transcriptional regulatory protein RtcR
VTKPLVAMGFIGTVMDRGPRHDRWSKWRPTISLCQQADLVIDRLELLVDRSFETLFHELRKDIKSVSPETEVRPCWIEIENPWDFESVFASLHGFARAYPFDTETEDYLVHITTGTHVAQICLFLLTESRHLPARLIQTSPPRRASEPGSASIIDLDLSRYDAIARRFAQEKEEATSILKSGIDTKNEHFNRLIERVEHVSVHSKAPILLTGPTGAGKSQLARQIFEVKRERRQIEGAFVEVNCATLRGDGAMSTLFGHVKGAFTGALNDRPGLLRKADGGLLFLDEIGELGLDEQAMLLRAIEDKVFLPMGGDKEAKSEFQLVAGTNRDLSKLVRQGRFRDDLLARLDLWTFRLPSLRERREDIAANLDYEIDRYARATGSRISFNKEARDRFLAFAISGEATWTRNFRDLGGAITRMGTIAAGGRITTEVVAEEVGRLRALWGAPDIAESGLTDFVPAETLATMDLFDRLQLDAVIRATRDCRSLSEAGRRLYAQSRTKRTVTNDADRLRKYLARFGLTWDGLRRPAEAN